jgi:hypothetical protein
LKSEKRMINRKKERRLTVQVFEVIRPKPASNAAFLREAKDHTEGKTDFKSVD